MRLRFPAAAILLAASPLLAREMPLSLAGAIEKALEQNPTMVGAVAEADASAARVDQARGKLLPRLDYIESATRSDNPVFVFGSLLNQGRFTEGNFALDRLNNPPPLSLFQSRFTLRQTLFAGGRNYLELRGRKLGLEEALEGQREAAMGVVFRVVQSYHGVQIAELNLEVTEDAVGVAGDDLRRVRAMLEAGMATEADVLSLQVHVADLGEQVIEARNLVAIQRAELNDAIGEPLDRELSLLTPLSAADAREARELEALEDVAMVKSPVVRRSELSLQTAELGHEQARAAFLPSIDVHAAWESDRVSFTGGGGTNWMVGMSLRLNLFNGLSDRAQVKEAEARLRQARARKMETENRVRLEVRRAFLELDAARQRLEVAGDAVEQARESHRITEARYEGGLNNVTDLLRSQNALLGAEARHLSAVFETRLAAAALELATGTLSPQSEEMQP